MLAVGRNQAAVGLSRIVDDGEDRIEVGFSSGTDHSGLDCSPRLGRAEGSLAAYNDHRIHAVHFPRDQPLCIQASRGLGSFWASQTVSQPRRSGISFRLPVRVAQHKQPLVSHIVAKESVVRTSWAT